MIRCMIVDDEQHAVDLLTSHISKVQLLKLQFATTNPLSAFQFVQQNSIDLVFLDIQMADLNGLQFMRLLDGKSKVILTTAYPEFALDGYEHDVIDYLLKPILFERFLKAVQKAMSKLTPLPAAKNGIITGPGGLADFIFVRSNARNKVVRILLQDIEYVESMGNYVSIYLPASRVITLMTMKELEEKLPFPRFIRVHNSYLVAFYKIAMIDGNELHIGKYIVPVGETYRKAFLQAIDNYVMNERK